MKKKKTNLVDKPVLVNSTAPSKAFTNDFFGHKCFCGELTAFETFNEDGVVRFCCHCNRRFVLELETAKILNKVKEFDPKKEGKQYFIYRKSNGYYGVLNNKTKQICTVSSNLDMARNYLKECFRDEAYFPRLVKSKFEKRIWIEKVE